MSTPEIRCIFGQEFAFTANTRLSVRLKPTFSPTKATNPYDRRPRLSQKKNLFLPPKSVQSVQSVVNPLASPPEMSYINNIH